MKELLVVDDVVVEQSLLTRKFACDLLKCKGACCSLPGGRGAPLLNSEIGEIKKALPEVIPHLTEDKKEAISKRGFYEGASGDYATTCIDDRDCVFVYREDGIAKCAIEKSFNEGKIDFRKPLSCHLYPIRVRRFGGDVLRYHELSDCKPAIEKGESQNIDVIDFVKAALLRLYGESWVNKLQTYRELIDVEPVPDGPARNTRRR